MVDSRQKGRVAETKARDELRKLTGLKWERIPSSGALDAKHGLKGDLYVPLKDNKYCVEVKHYKDDQLTSKILTGKDPILLKWWAQTIRQAEQVDKKPLLIFKFDRSKWFVAYDCMEEHWDRPLKDIPLGILISTIDGLIAIDLLQNWGKYRDTEEDWINA